MIELNATVDKVTRRIIERSVPGRRRYLDMMDRESERHTNRNALSCSNLAHGFAASEADKPAIAGGRAAARNRRLVGFGSSKAMRQVRARQGIAVGVALALAVH